MQGTDDRSGRRKGRLYYYPLPDAQPWPTGPCGQVASGCTLCGRGLGNGVGLAMCVECGDALRNSDSPLGRLLRMAYAEARRAAAAVRAGDANAGH